MPTRKTPSETSPFNWTSSASTVLDPRLKRSEQQRARLGRVAAERVEAMDGDLVKSGARSQPTVKAK